MLIKVTNQCGMGCSHCMEESTPKPGQHMTPEIFEKALLMTRRVEGAAWALGIPPLILLSGGECSEHPDIVKVIEAVIAQGLVPLLITNGMWLGNPELREAILVPGRTIFVQVTNDSRFYPTVPPKFDDERVMYVDKLTHLIPLGRALRKKGLADMGLPLKNAPSSFNLRSATRKFGSIEGAVAMLRARSAMGQSGQCIPSVSHEGHVMAGESRSCFKIGTVDSSNEELTQALINMQCNNCGLVDNLTQEQKRAIGESSPSTGAEL
jgi:hypothetical protein